MILRNGEIRPGRVLEVVDAYGTIKASACGLFSEEDDTAQLPPVYPFMQSSASNFNQPKVNDLIWVLFFTDNPQELFYIFRGNTKSAASHILKKNPKDSQILASRNSGFGKAELYFSSDDGWKMANDKGSMQIDKEYNVTLEKSDVAHRTIDINDDCISLGSKGGSSEPAVLGNKLKDTLRKLEQCLNAIQITAEGNPYTAPVGSAMKAPLEEFSKTIEQICSDNVTLD